MDNIKQKKKELLIEYFHSLIDCCIEKIEEKDVDMVIEVTENIEKGVTDKEFNTFEELANFIINVSSENKYKILSVEFYDKLEDEIVMAADVNDMLNLITEFEQQEMYS